MKNSGRFLIACLAFILTAVGSAASVQDNDVHKLWTDCRLEGVLLFDIFNQAIQGQKKIENLIRTNIITIIDYSKPSTEKRFFVIDLEKKQLMYSCLVSHGKNSGDNYAKNFSNEPESLESSLGFFLTSETYYGDNGYSLRLEGLENGINDNAQLRQMVIHGAGYVSEAFIKKYGRIGRSWGCPALPPEISKEIIDVISGGTCVYVFANDSCYRTRSLFINSI